MYMDGIKIFAKTKDEQEILIQNLESTDKIKKWNLDLRNVPCLSWKNGKDRQ